MGGNSKSLPFLKQFQSINLRELSALKTTFVSIINRIVSLLAIVLYVRLTLPYLGNELFGIWMSMTGILTFLSIVSDLGLGVSMVNFVAVSNVGKSKHTTHEITSSAFFFLSCMAILIGLIYLIFQPLILAGLTNGIANLSTRQEAFQGIQLLMLFFLVGLPFISIEKTLEGLQLQYVSISWIMAGNILSIVATFIVARLQLGLPWLIVSTIGSQTFVRMICWITVYSGRLNGCRPSIGKVQLSATKALLNAGFILFALNLFNVVANFIDTVIITRKIGVQYVAQFSVVHKLSNLFLFFLFYTSSFWPAFAEAHAKNDKLWIRRKLAFLIKLNLLLGLTFGLFIIVFGKSIILLWSDNNLAEPSVTMLLSFASFNVLYGVMACVSLVFNAGYIVKKYVIYFCGASLIVVLLKYILLSPETLDYYMFIPIVPYFIGYFVPCYKMIQKYLKEE